MASSPSPTTVHPSTHFLESAGTILFHLSTQQVVLLHHKGTNEYLLPKGRRDIGENRDRTAIRETEEETGFPCRLLPVTLTTKQPRPGCEDAGGRQEGVCEPFMLAQRLLEDGAVKIVWWYIAAVDEGAEVGKGEPEFEARLVGFEEAVELLTFRDDRAVVARAVDIFRDTVDPES